MGFKAAYSTVVDGIGIAPCGASLPPTVMIALAYKRITTYV
ncbi:hypothetical protein O59_002336 [Cellvibrio sp. BR]|nr:hypothetical protein O59_002336 [Cellvibrio sp. BR]